MTGSVVQRVIEQHGADNILQCLPENYAPLLVENIKKGGYTHVVAGHSAFGKNIMPRVSALLDTQQISDITGIEGEDSE
jgi:electron transfer flavoprotein alpha subunit